MKSVLAHVNARTAHSTTTTRWVARAAVVLVGVLAVAAWMWAFPDGSDAATVQTDSGCYTVEMCETTYPDEMFEGDSSSVWKCGGATAIGAYFGGPSGAGAAGVGCLWSEAW